MKSKPCKTCGNTWHTKAFCPRNRKPIKKYGKQGARWLAYRDDWIKRHPADPTTGRWYCALRISPNCHHTMTVKNLTLDHKIPRSAAPHLRYVDSNIQPACWPCNTQKGSKKMGYEVRRVSKSGNVLPGDVTDSISSNVV